MLRLIQNQGFNAGKNVVNDYFWSLDECTEARDLAGNGVANLRLTITGERGETRHQKSEKIAVIQASDSFCNLSIRCQHQHKSIPEERSDGTLPSHIGLRPCTGLSNFCRRAKQANSCSTEK